MRAKVNGTELFYEMEGEGVPLLIMHGGMGFDHSYFRPWLDPLSGRMQLIYYDHRGNGRSTLLHDFTGIDHATWAGDADALRRHLKHEKVVLFGHSCGAFVAQEYALRNGKSLKGLILCCAAPVLDYPDVIMANARAMGTPEQLQLALNLLTTPFTGNDQMRLELEKLMPLYFKNHEPDQGIRMLKAMKLNYNAFNHCTSVWLSTVNFLPSLGDIAAPTLIISGKEDWIMPPAQTAKRLHAAIPNSDLVILENSGHYPFIEEQARFLEIIDEWVGRLQ